MIENKLLPDKLFKKILKHVEEHRYDFGGAIIHDEKLITEIRRFWKSILKTNRNKEVILNNKFDNYDSLMNHTTKYLDDKVDGYGFGTEYTAMAYMLDSYFPDSDTDLIKIKVQYRSKISDVSDLTHYLYLHLTLEENIQHIINKQIELIDCDIEELNNIKKRLLELKTF